MEGVDVGKNAEYRFSRKAFYMKTCLLCLVFSTLFTVAVVTIVEPPREPLGGIFDLVVTDLDGNQIHLKDFQHKVILAVNVASNCGLTAANYAGLQRLHEMYSKNGLVIIGFPSNEFGSQEPGSNAEIKEFTGQLGAKFLISEKTMVNGPNPHPVYEYIHSHYPEDIQWNFEKVLFDKNGIPFRKYESSVTPHDLSNHIIKLLYTT